MKLCKDCKNRRQAYPSGPSLDDRCVMEEMTPCLVTGKVKYQFCERQRASLLPIHCGEVGRLWEPL